MHHVLLGMLEAGTARRYPDTGLGVEVDISACSWIATANTLEGIPRPLLSRLDVVEVAPPGRAHAEALIDGILADLARGWGVETDAPPVLPRSARRTIADALEATGSARLVVRQVRTALATLLQIQPRRLNS